MHYWLFLLHIFTYRVIIFGGPLKWDNEWKFYEKRCICQLNCIANCNCSSFDVRANLYTLSSQFCWRKKPNASIVDVHWTTTKQINFSLYCDLVLLWYHLLVLTFSEDVQGKCKNNKQYKSCKNCIFKILHLAYYIDLEP